MSVRVRFAPSPTGLLHVGALRTVLFDYLFAQHNGGQNILRIEDTDRTRYNADSEKEFVDTLAWVGIEFDEGPHIGGPHGPYRQSERKEAGIYSHWIERLIELGHAYMAFDTPEELNEMREYQQINKMPTGYFGGDWRDADPSKAAAAIAEGKPYVIRQRIPRDRTVVVEDAIRGRVEFDTNTLPDPVLIKGDGMPTYHFAAMVDDHLMEITHVLRGEEWIATSPIHWLLFEMFGWDRPVFVHCPVIVGTDGKKLSKRHGATRVLDYAAQGYDKEALKNFIALIGWSPGDDREVMSQQELIAAFDLKGLQASPGRFDIEKLRWLNGHRIRQMSTEELLDTILEYVKAPYTMEYWMNFVDENPMPNKKPTDGPEVWRRLVRLKEKAETNRSYVLEAVRLEQERVQTLADFGEACEFFLVDEVFFDEKAVEKWFGQEHVGKLLRFLLERVSEAQTASVEWCESLIRQFASDHGFDKLGPVVHPTRVALTGKTVGPGLFELMNVLGPSRMKARLERALAMLK
ncbi:MAG: glutamate--tRNA ligase [Armatimonadetes bacterium 55-13]|nr:MAG: glutamate--tRNA ligase [Armatimonadetes bacterium 55-13]